MVTVYKGNGNNHPAVGPSPDGQGYTTYQAPDTRVPPRPLPVMKDISVDGVVIPEDAILREAQNHPASSPGAALRSAAEALVIRQLLLAEAERSGLLAAKGNDETTAPETPEDRAIRLLLEDRLNVPVATEEECRTWYERNPSRFMSPALHQARHILVAAAEGDDARREEARLLAQQLCNRLQDNPGSFAALAREHSACVSASNGGNLGQLSPGSTVAEFESALSGMEPGTISRAPVSTRYGYHVVALDHSVPPELLPFDAVRQRIADWLEARSWSRASAQFVAILAGKSDIRGIDIGGSGSPLVQ